MTDTANANDIIMKGLSNETEGLGRFGHHPNPAIDFCIEVETLESRLHQAEHGLSKPRSVPETIAAVLHDIQKALNFRVGGDEGAVSAKHLLRSLEDKAKSLILTDTASAPERAFEFNTQGKAPSQKTKRIPPGLYTVSWKDGGTSEVAIGMTSNGDNWMAPTNWLRPAMIHSVEGDVWGSFERLERINATHCDELVAAAYLDARDSINEYPRVAPEADEANAYDEQIEHCQGIIDARIPANAISALTARDERMKAEGAREAQAKIARLIEALKPFSDMAGEMFARNWDDSGPVIALDNPKQTNRVYVSDFFAARRAIGAEHASDCAVHNGPAYPLGSCTCGAALQENADE